MRHDFFVKIRFLLVNWATDGRLGELRADFLIARVGKLIKNKTIVRIFGLSIFSGVGGGGRGST
jgi:hypothetical protein